ncbi:MULTISPECIES: hypothetical protein [unclassified Nostoc]|nr:MULTISPECIES: hypothetical protein [unclassified Nostoc]MDZ8030938.1 hypothetical protein [Nostoc sp. DedSLP04]MDZ8138889.1 hypothetical protein [Nostoc sp. DedQUE04]
MSASRAIAHQTSNEILAIEKKIYSQNCDRESIFIIIKIFVKFYGRN